METEIWKEIPRYNGAYLISNFGNMKSTERYCYHGDKPWLVKERLLSKVVGHTGYIEYQVTYNKKHRSEKAHRLVAEAFIPNPENKPQVNHIDGNKQNNRVENLEWCTNGENSKHAFRTGLNHANYTPSNSRKILQINKDTNEIIAKYPSINAALRHFNLPITKRANIVECCKGKQKTGYGYKWKYEDEME